MTPVIIQMITWFVAVVIALIGVIYKLFNSTIDLKIEALKKDFSNDLNNGLNKLHMEIELCRHDKKLLESVIKTQNNFNNQKPLL